MKHKIFANMAEGEIYQTVDNQMLNSSMAIAFIHYRDKNAYSRAILCACANNYLVLPKEVIIRGVL